VSRPDQKAHRLTGFIFTGRKAADNHQVVRSGGETSVLWTKTSVIPGETIVFFLACTRQLPAGGLSLIGTIEVRTAADSFAHAVPS
jgi:hypothetical protein